VSAGVLARLRKQESGRGRWLLGRSSGASAGDAANPPPATTTRAFPPDLPVHLGSGRIMPVRTIAHYQGYRTTPEWRYQSSHS
jgi:hypothetical protein